MSEKRLELPREYHEALLPGQRHTFPDSPKRGEVWDRYFPRDEPFCLCAKVADGMSDVIEVGDLIGKPKATKPAELAPEAAHILLGQIRAQASTEFGSIQPHTRTFQPA